MTPQAFSKPITNAFTLSKRDEIVYADGTYESAVTYSTLTARNVNLQVTENRTCGHPLNDERNARSREKSKTRSRVVHVFSQMSEAMKASFQDASAWRATQPA